MLEFNAMETVPYCLGYVFIDVVQYNHMLLSTLFFCTFLCVYMNTCMPCQGQIEYRTKSPRAQ